MNVFSVVSYCTCISLCAHADIDGLHLSLGTRRNERRTLDDRTCINHAYIEVKQLGVFENIPYFL